MRLAIMAGVKNSELLDLSGWIKKLSGGGGAQMIALRGWFSLGGYSFYWALIGW